MRGRGLPRWWALPLEMLSTCTCYSRLHWTWFGYVSLSYCTTWPEFWHVLGSYWTICRAPVVPHVSFLMEHMSCCGWVMCHFFIRPCVLFLLVHVAIYYSTTCHGAIRPRFVFWFGHVAWWLPSTYQIFISPRVMHWFIHVSHFYFITWPSQVLPRAQQSTHHKSNSRSSLLHRLTI